jgi:O-antigen/teichoic acid export membrane protein
VFKSVAKNFSIFTLAMIAEAVITFLFLAFVARQFGPSLFGKYILIIAYVHVVSVFVNAGIEPIALRELARHRDNSSELFGDIFSLRLVLGVFGYLILMLVVEWSGESPEYMTLIGIAGLMLIIEPFTASYRVYYTAHERMTIPSAYSVASAALSALAGGTLLILGFGLFELILSNVVTALMIGIIWSVRFRARVLRFRFRARFAAWRRLLVLIIPFAPIHASNQISRVLNIFLLGQTKGPLPMEQSVGYYSPASSLSNTFVRLVMGLRRALIPPIAAKLQQGHSVTREIDVAFKLVIALFCLPIILGTAYMSPEIIALVFGDQYLPSTMVLQMLGWAAALQIAAFIPEIFLFSHPDHKMQDYIAGPVTSVVLNAMLCILLIQEYGILGAAAAAIVGRLVYFLFVAHYYRRQAPGQALNPHDFRDVGVLVISSFIVWHFTFTWIENAWLAFTMAGIATLPLIAMFLLCLRSQLQVRAAA